MSVNGAEYRLDGIYRQRQEGFLMQRVKLAAGAISAEQARCVSSAAQKFGRGDIHLTSRGSMEIHWLTEERLEPLKRTLAGVGLTSRGACGGAVRGVTCASQGAVGFPVVERLAHRLHRHFTGNPRFERLPKKFKIGIEATAAGRRHLIQDVGLVLANSAGADSSFDVYIAGGLGREPQPGFLLEAAVGENRIIPLIEAIARVYAAHTPAGKRLKHLLREIGENEFRRLLALEPAATEELPPVTGLPGNLLGEQADAACRVIVHIPLGELSGSQLSQLAGIADRWSGGFLMVTADQNIAYNVLKTADVPQASAELEAAGFAPSGTLFRVCPGTATCLVALSAAREVAKTLGNVMSATGRTLEWAISGCPNSCTQPQLADVGIVTAALVKDEHGERTPRFDLYRAGEQPFGTVVHQGLTLEQLCEVVENLE
jgi:ferredoxin-nitrite reductase